jgi:acetylornithine/N-succinyldiaminopimelate aminotransferase
VTNAEAIALSAAHEVGVYARQPVAFVRGRGAELWDADGKRYLDFFAGLAVNNLGHCHPAVVEAVRAQAATLLHASNVYYTLPAGELCALLCRHSFAERVFLANSGAEANEAAMKLARRWGSQQGGGRFEILATIGSFHGRTFATLTATGQEKYHTGFLPLLPGVRLVPYGDLAAMEAAVRDETVAIMVEPIQGEGGVRAAPERYLRGLREIADEFGLLLVYDEVQCGMGRTGKLFAHEWEDVPPDIMAIAKALGNGFPVGACLATERAAVGMVAGTHGSTFGGNPLAMAAGNAVLDTMLEPGFFDRVDAMAKLLRNRLETLVRSYPKLFSELRGAGLLLGIRCVVPAADFVTKLRQNGLLTLTAGENILRVLPPLIVGEREIDEALDIINQVAREWPQ